MTNKKEKNESERNAATKKGKHFLWKQIIVKIERINDLSDVIKILRSKIKNITTGS